MTHVLHFFDADTKKNSERNCWQQDPGVPERQGCLDEILVSQSRLAVPEDQVNQVKPRHRKHWLPDAAQQ